MRLMALAVAFAGLLVAVPAAAVDRLVDDHLVPCISVLPIHATISDAVAAASPGETILVCPGNYADNVVVTKADLTIRGQGIVRVTPGDPTLPGFDVEADGVTIQGFDVSGYSDACGVSVSANRSDVRDNHAHDNATGICILTGVAHRVRYNVVEGNTGVGISLADVSGDITNNTVKDNGLHGIAGLGCTFGVTIDHNAALENHKVGILAADCDSPTITNNTVQGTGYISAGNSAGIVVQGGMGALVKLNLVQHAVEGVLLTGTTGATATFNSISFNDVGLDVMTSDGVTVTRNNVSRSPIVDCRWDQLGTNVLTNNSCGTEDPPGAFD